MDPLIKEYVESNLSIIQILKKFHEKYPENKIYEKIYQVRENLVSGATPKKNYFDDRFLSEKKYDHDLIVLYYQTCGLLANFHRNQEEYMILYKKSYSFISKDTPPIIAYTTKASMLVKREKYKFTFEYFLKHFGSSPRFGSSIENYFLIMARIGQLRQDKLWNIYYENKLLKKNTNLMELIILINSIEKFQVAKIQELKDRMIKGLENFETKFYGEYANYYLLLYQVIFETNHWPVSKFESEKNMLAMYFLINRQIEKALQIVKEHLALNSELDTSIFLSFTILRCELVNKNFERALNWLQNYEDLTDHEYLKYFFYFRIEIAIGNRETALQYYHKALTLSRQHNAEGLLNFELSLAYELSMADLRYLLENVSKVNSEDVSLNKTLLNRESLVSEEIIGTSAVILEIKEKIKNYANSEIPVLITGETGVGKDLVARMLHQQSQRKEESFQAINCGAISESLLLSELFGHEAGSFTGANKVHKGLFEAVGKGTIFLDEIGEISPALQIALLRVLDQNEYKPVGSNKFKKCHCRVLFATNANLEQMVEEKNFRKDLLFRLKRLEILIPPLRDRQKDIPELVMHYFSIGRSDQKSPFIPKDLMQAFQEYFWPGNIRQLKNEIEKMRMLHSEKLIYNLSDYPFQEKEYKTVEKINEKKSNIQIVPLKSSTYSVETVLNNSKGSFRRLDKIKELFLQNKKFSRKELIDITKFAPDTITKDLEKLCSEGVIVRVMPNATARTHYFILKEE